MKKNISTFIAAALLTWGLLSGCKPETLDPPLPLASATSTLTAAPSPQPSPTLSPSPTPTPVPTSLTICVGKPVENLFFYNLGSSAGNSLLAALYDGPFKSQNLNNSIPMIWSLLPEASTLETVEVLPGDPYFDPGGQLEVLGEGTTYRPAGCAEASCWETYTGSAAVPMEVWVLRFRLRADLRWSDGVALTAADAIYAYNLARALRPASQRALLERTADYRLVDELTVEWRGLPGYQSPEPAAQLFWPLPEHAWSELSPAELATADIAALNPPGYGPFKVLTWDGELGVTMGRNPEYFRAAQGLPGVDLLIFRFVDPGQAALDLLLNGACDVLDSSATQESLLADYAASAGRGEIRISRQPASLEMIVFNTEPYDIYQARLLGLAKVRQALAQCFDRSELAESVLSGLAFPADSYLSEQHPDYAGSQNGELSFDLAAGQQRLQQAGWLDLDLNPATPRTAKNVPGVPDGTRLALTYLVSSEADRVLAGEQFQQSMAACGIGVELVISSPAEYLAAGPDGPVFGRKFQVAGFAWAAAGGQVPCTLFTTAQIPGPYPKSPLDWGGANAGAYRSQAFDQACQQGSFGLVENPARRAAALLAQQIFREDIPALPLYWRPRLALARAGICGLAQTTWRGGLLAAPELLYRSPDCPEP